MIDEILKLAINSGLFAALFSFLLFYVLKDSAKREKKYQETIDKLNCHLEVVNDIKEDMGEIKVFINKTANKNNLEKIKKGDKESA